MKKLFVAAGIAAMALSTGGVAYAGQANGLNGQACAASYGDRSLGDGLHKVQQFLGNNAGGVQAAVATFCP